MYCRLFLKEDFRLKRFRIVLNCIFAFALILMLISIVGLEENSTYTKDVFDEDLSDGWTLSLPDGTRSEMAFPYGYEDGNPNIRIFRTLPHVPDYAVLKIMCNYRSMTAYVDGEEIFHALPEPVIFPSSRRLTAAVYSSAAQI